ncbi:MAG: PspC domain-containing protein [Oscillospiraceae bacterium]|nr:PspC domain-containing protein [Oscillospiraceae bacterium]
MKRLYKIDQGKVICGVCGGIAEYFNIDPSLVRLITIIVSVFLGAGFGGLVAYIIAACILPRKDSLDL